MSISLSNVGLVFDYTISSWTGNKTDSETSEDVANRANSSRNECGRYVKKVLGDCQELKNIGKYAQNVRNWIKESTLPYSRSQRIIPTNAFMGFIQQVKVKQNEYENLVETFLNAYSGIIERARNVQGLLFRESDCPPIDELRNDFKFSYEVLPIPEVNQFDGRLGFTELEEQYKRDFEVAQARVVEKCRNQILSQIGIPIKTAISRLEVYLGNMEKERFYKNWVTKIWDNARSARSFNVIESDVINSLCDDIDALSLRFHSIDAIRHNTGNLTNELVRELKPLADRIENELLTSLITYGEELHGCPV